MKKLMEEFKAFAFKGNVVDMAIGVVIGGAFGKIVTSLVNDVIMPLVALIVGATDFTSLYITLGENAEGPIKLMYGNFIQNIVDFLIVAFCIFMVIKVMNQARFKREEKKAEEPAPDPEDLVLLREIRDLLKK